MIPVVADVITPAMTARMSGIFFLRASVMTGGRFSSMRSSLSLIWSTASEVPSSSIVSPCERGTFSKFVCRLCPSRWTASGTMR